MLLVTNLSQGLENILIVLIAMLMAIAVATPFHEFAHAYAAKREGDYTAVAHRRCTLAALPHFDFQGFLFLMLFGFGWAKPVPVDTRNFKNGRKSEFRVAIAGIVTNVLLGTFFMFVYMLILKIKPEFYVDHFFGRLVHEFLNVSVSLNFMLAVFNLLPVYPLDGYKIVDSFCRYENKFLVFMKKYSFWIFLLLIITNVYYFIYELTAGVFIDGLIKLFSWILRL